MGVSSGQRIPIETYMACWEWGKYLGDEALSRVSTFASRAGTELRRTRCPRSSKAGANYMNSQLIRMEADVNGYAEGIALDQQGYISEGSGENIFVIRDGKMLTPPLGASVLPGITRDSVIKIAQSLDIPIVETIIPRELLYIADEVFFTGTAAEITPIRSVDRVKVGEGHRGPITERLQKEFFGIVNGTAADRFGWLTPVKSREFAGVQK